MGWGDRCRTKLYGVVLTLHFSGTRGGEIVVEHIWGSVDLAAFKVNLSHPMHLLGIKKHVQSYMLLLSKR